MSEFTRLVRYVVPVCVLGVYFFLFVFIASFPGADPLQELLGYVKESNVAAILSLGGTLAFALGFLINTIHHLFFWYCPLYPKTSYARWFLDIQTDGLLQINDLPTTRLSKRDLWHVINVIWHTLRSADQGMKKLNSRNDSLIDLMHANGSCLVSVLLAFAFAVLHFLFPLLTRCDAALAIEPCFAAVSVGLFVFLTGIHYAAYRLSVDNVNRFVQTALFHVLSYRRGESGDRPYVFYYRG